MREDGARRCGPKSAPRTRESSTHRVTRAATARNSALLVAGSQRGRPDQPVGSEGAGTRRVELRRMSLTDIASLATAAGVVLVVAQLVLGRRQTRTALEDDLAREYRGISAELPVSAFFDVPDATLPLQAWQEDVVNYVRYFDLSNQQVFLRTERRVSANTWRLWADGMGDNLSREAFADAWEYVRHHSPKSFNELASVYEHWDHDPAYWSPPVWMLPWKWIRQKPDRPTAWVPKQPGTSVAGSRRS